MCVSPQGRLVGRTCGQALLEPAELIEPVLINSKVVMTVMTNDAGC